MRLGVCLYLLGRYYRAIEVLEQADGGAMAHYYLAKCHFARQEYREAVESYKAAEKAGYDAGECALGRAEALRYAGDAAAALAVLDSLSGAIEQTAEYLSQRAATVSALGGNPQGSGGALRAGRRGRPQPSRRPVRPGPGERPLRQRRHGHGVVQAGRQPLSRPTSARW